MPLLDLGSVTGMVGKSSNTAANSSVSSWATYAASTSSASLLGEGYAKVGAFRAGHDLTRLVCSLMTGLGCNSSVMLIFSRLCVIVFICFWSCFSAFSTLSNRLSKPFGSRVLVFGAALGHQKTRRRSHRFMSSRKSSRVNNLSPSLCHSRRSFNHHARFFL